MAITEAQAEAALHAMDFVPIPEWPEYEINTYGLIRRLAKACGTSEGRLLKWTVINNGYAKVCLSRYPTRAHYLVHRLMAITFLGDPTGFDVCHYDGDKLNNHISNLRIDTRRGNMQDQIRMGKTPRGEKCGSNKYSQELISVIKSRLVAGERVAALSLEYGIPKPTLYGIHYQINWGWL